MSATPDLDGIALGLIADTALIATVPFLAADLVTRGLGRASAASRHAVWACALGAPLVLAAAALHLRGPLLTLPLPSAWLATGALGAWALGVLLVLLPLVRGVVALLRARRLGQERDGLVWSPAVAVPLTFAGTILMPMQARDWSAADLRAARLHEQAHLRRGDWWVHLGAWLVCALLWFHPLAWWARRNLALEAERAADDHVLAAGVRPSDYARQLLGLARGPAAALSMSGRPSPTAVRVHALLGPHSRSARRWPALLTGLGLVLSITPGLASWAPWSPPAAVLECLTPELLP